MLLLLLWSVPPAHACVPHCGQGVRLVQGNERNPARGRETQHEWGRESPTRAGDSDTLLRMMSLDYSVRLTEPSRGLRFTRSWQAGKGEESRNRAHGLSSCPIREKF